MDIRRRNDQKFEQDQALAEAREREKMKDQSNHYEKEKQ